jgi:Spy/CpxP family protein refolding chaperone
MKVTKSMVIAALVVGNLLAWDLALRAADTNMPPSAPPAGGPPAGQRPPGMRAGPSFDQLAQQLDLTDDQKPKVKSILEERDKKVAELNSDTSLSREDRRPKMQSIREETMAQLKAVLTPDQFDKLQKMARNRRPGGPGGPPPGGGRPGGTNAPAAPPQT